MNGKIERLNEQMKDRFDLWLDVSSASHLQTVKEHYLAKRKFLLQRYGISEALHRDDYAKAVFISEAATLFLREIAPKRKIPRK